MRPAVTKHPNSVAQTTEICPTALEAGRPGSRWRQGRLVAGPLSSASGRRLLAAFSPGPSACERMVAEQAQVSVSSHKGSGSVGSGLTLMTSDFNAFCKDPVPRYSDAGAGVRPSAYEVGMGGGGRRAPGGEPGRLVSCRWQPPSSVSSGVCHPPPTAPGHCVPSPRDQNSLPTSRSVPPTSPPSPCQSLLPAEDHRPVALWISFPFSPSATWARRLSLASSTLPVWIVPSASPSSSTFQRKVLGPALGLSAVLVQNLDSQARRGAANANTPIPEPHAQLTG